MPTTTWFSRRCQPAARSLMRLHRAGDIDDETLHALERDLDIEEIGALEGRV